MHTAASMAASAFCFGTGSPLASGAAPVGTETKPPAEMTRSQVLRSTIRSFSTGNARAPRLNHELRAVSAVTSVELAGHRSLDAGPGATLSIITLHEPQIPSRESLSKAMGLGPRTRDARSGVSSISRKNSSGVILRTS
jgi:hypothetical protein